MVCQEGLLISEKIQSLLDTIKFVFKVLGDLNLIYPPQYSTIIKEIREIITSLKSYIHAYKDIIPQKTVDTINLDIQTLEEILENERPIYFKGIVTSSFIKLSAITRILSYDLNNVQVHIRKNVENAFNHLQYCIIANRATYHDWNPELWTPPEKKIEPYFEALGASHFLSKNIWAFKVDAKGHRTDLVLSEPQQSRMKPDIIQNADGLVLTEWKMATQTNVMSKIDEALTQAKLYSEYALYNELSSCRYLVMVSDDYLSIDNREIKDGPNLYRIKNIARKPLSPSKQK